MRLIKLLTMLVLCSFLLNTCEKGDSNSLFPPNQQSMAQIFNDRYGLKIQRVPVIYNEFTDQYVSTVYIDGSLYRAYMDQNAEVNFKITQPLFPKGETRVLCILRLSDSLFMQKDLVQEYWENAQAGINALHQNFVLGYGQSEPIVSFKTDNYYLSHEDFPIQNPNENTMGHFQDFARQTNLDLEEYDIFLWMELDLEQPGGGWADWKAQLAYVNWIYENDLTINQENFDGLAYAAYQHEIGHVWGWEHDWTDPFLNIDFITIPSLFGWIDIDGDGFVEILDPFPYQ